MLQYPLEGLRVIDLTHALSGPFCTMHLADMGADVIKVEKPGGDLTRYMGKDDAPESAPFIAVNRNKRSVVIDLERPAGKELLHQLLAGADVLVENFRPGTMAALGFPDEEIMARYPALIYASISGFGQTGPYAEHRGLDLIAQGMSGLMSVTGEPGGNPAKVGVPISDLNGGLYAAYGILNAYIYRLKTGKGQRVDTSLLEGVLPYLVWESTVYWSEGIIGRPRGSAHPLSAPYQAFQTSDGWFTIGAATEAIWQRLCRVLEMEELMKDPRFRSNTARMANLAELVPILAARFRTHTTAHWVGALQDAGVPVGPLYDVAQVWADPHIRAREMVVEIEHPVRGKVNGIGIPVKLSHSPGRIRTPAPTLGQHTEEVLRAVGVGEDQLRQWRQDGIIG